MAKGWVTPKTATVKFNVAMNENGNIAQSGDTAVSQKVFSMQGIKTDADFDAASGTYSAFVTGLAGGRYDSDTGKKLVEYKVGEIE